MKRERTESGDDSMAEPQQQAPLPQIIPSTPPAGVVQLPSPVPATTPPQTHTPNTTKPKPIVPRPATLVPGVLPHVEGLPFVNAPALTPASPAHPSSTSNGGVPPILPSLALPGLGMGLPPGIGLSFGTPVAGIPITTASPEGGITAFPNLAASIASSTVGATSMVPFPSGTTLLPPFTSSSVAGQQQPSQLSEPPPLVAPPSAPFGISAGVTNSITHQPSGQQPTRARPRGPTYNNNNNSTPAVTPPPQRAQFTNAMDYLKEVKKKCAPEVTAELFRVLREYKAERYVWASPFTLSMCDNAVNSFC